MPPIAVDVSFVSDGTLALGHESLTNGTAKGMPIPSTAEVTVNGGDHSSSNRSKIAIPLNDQPSYKARKLRVATIGAGFSGLTLAHKLRYQHPEMQDIVENVIYEARGDVGGTWLVNTYPGVQCDVAAHLYVRVPLSNCPHCLLTLNV